VNILAIAKRVHLLTGLGSRGNTAKPGTVPTTLAGQTDELAELVEWVLMALTNFQTMYKWGWLIQQGMLAFTSGVSTVVPTAGLTNYRDWIPFKQGGRRYVLRGSNLLTSGDFSSASAWTAGAGWAVANSIATGTTASSTLAAAASVTSGTTYRVQYTITRTAGSIQPSLAGVNGTSRSASGTYTDDITVATSGASTLVFTGTSFTGTVDDVILTAASGVAELPVYFMEYADFRGLRDRSPVASGAPMYFTIRPDQTWEVYPTPDANYALKLDYLCKPKIYTTSDDSTNFEDWPSTGRGLPTEFHDAVVWYAVRYWAETRAKLDMFQIADRRFEELIRPIKARYLPAARI
jgi:hypothetical protein